MSQRGIRIKLLVFDGKITISYTNYVFENATKNFVNTSKGCLQGTWAKQACRKLHKHDIVGGGTGSNQKKNRCCRAPVGTTRKKGIMQDAKQPFPHFLGRGGANEIRPSAGRASTQGTGGDRPSSARKAPPGSRRSPCPGREAPAP